MICDHNEKLASHDRKKNENFVMLIFLFFGRGIFRNFLSSSNIRRNDEFDERKVPKKFQ
jgi:hypothetical protein